MGEVEFAALITAARKIVTSSLAQTTPVVESASAFLKRLFDEYGHGESHDTIEDPPEPEA